MLSADMNTLLMMMTAKAQQDTVRSALVRALAELDLPDEVKALLMAERIAAGVFRESVRQHQMSEAETQEQSQTEAV